MQASLPIYALYGEPGGAFDAGGLHCESIAARSRLHDWRIGAHRHEALCQVLVLRAGHCAARLDDRRVELDGPCLLVVPPLVVHGFHFSPEVEGTVVTLQEARVDPGLRELLRQPRAEALATDRVDVALAALLDEYRGEAPWRALALDAAVTRLLVAVVRALHAAQPPAADPAQRRAEDTVQRFRALIEQRYRTQPSMAECAEALGLPTSQLNRLCHRVLGHHALAVLHARLLLEAQRELAYTALSIKQIAFGLGFADAAYFTRFFRRMTGLSPRAMRACARAPSGDACAPGSTSA